MEEKAAAYVYHSCAWCQKFLLDYDDADEPVQRTTLDLCDSTKPQAVIKMVNGFKGISYYQDPRVSDIAGQVTRLRLASDVDHTILNASRDNCLFAKAISRKLRTAEGEFHIREIFVWRRGP